MKRKLFLLATVVLCSTVYSAEIKRYDVADRKEDLIVYKGDNKELKGGIVTGFGSGMFFKEKDKNGNLYFYMITDRGPNTDGPIYIDGDKEKSAKIFPVPKFCPQIAIVKVSSTKAEILKTIDIKFNNKKISGLPVPEGEIGNTNEAALNEKMEDMGYDKNGLDPEAIAVDKKGNFWISDEYGPFIVNINGKTGNIIKKYSPGNGIPEILKNRQPNRGMEGLTIDEKGNIYGIIQSTLDINQETKNSAQFLRVVKLNPKTGKTEMFAYPHDVIDYKKSKDAKIGDMASIGKNRFLIIEQGKQADKKMKNIIYIADFSKAEDISNIKTVDGKELEYEKNRDKLGIKMAEKNILIDLREFGWEEEKAEGVAVIDKKTIAIVSDNDFGIGVEAENGDNDKITEYKQYKDGKITLDGKEENVKIKVVKTDIKTKLWVIKLEKNIEDYLK
jgi:hypothetical protein